MTSSNVFLYRFFLHVLLVPVAEKRLMDVKLGELGSWLGGRDFTPNGIIASIRRGEEAFFFFWVGGSF